MKEQEKEGVVIQGRSSCIPKFHTKTTVILLLPKTGVKLENL